MEFEMEGGIPDEQVEAGCSAQDKVKEPDTKKVQEEEHDTHVVAHPSHKRITSANVAKVVLTMIKKLGVNSSEATLKKNTVKAFWRLRSKLWEKNKKRDEAEASSPDVEIIEVVEKFQASARTQRSSSRKSMKRMARKHGQKKKKKQMQVIEDTIEDDGIVEADVVVTPKELRTARSEATKVTEAEQEQVKGNDEMMMDENMGEST